MKRVFLEAAGDHDHGFWTSGIGFVQISKDKADFLAAEYTLVRNGMVRSHLIKAVLSVDAATAEVPLLLAQ